MSLYRPTYQFERNERFYKLNKEYGMSINEIALNSLHNPDKLSQQRIAKIIQVHSRKLLEV